jgi:hypothetical protein
MMSWKRCHVFWRCTTLTVVAFLLVLCVVWWEVFNMNLELALPVERLLADIPGVELAPGAELTFPHINRTEAVVYPAERGYFTRYKEFLADYRTYNMRSSESWWSLGHSSELVGDSSTFKRIRTLQALPTQELVDKEVQGHPQPELLTQRHRMTRAALLALLAVSGDGGREPLQRVRLRDSAEEGIVLTEEAYGRAVPASERREGHPSGTFVGTSRIRIGGSVFDCRVYVSNGRDVEWFAPGIGRLVSIYETQNVWGRRPWAWQRKVTSFAIQLDEVLLPESDIYWNVQSEN